MLSRLIKEADNLCCMEASGLIEPKTFFDDALIDVLNGEDGKIQERLKRSLN